MQVKQLMLSVMQFKSCTMQLRKFMPSEERMHRAPKKIYSVQILHHASDVAFAVQGNLA